MPEDEDQTYYRRVAVHGDIDDEDIPQNLLADENEDPVIEILYLRNKDEYQVCSRHHYSSVFYAGHGSVSCLEDALILAIDAATDKGHPILKRIYTYAPTTDNPEPGEDRIPVPWAEDDEE